MLEPQAGPTVTLWVRSAPKVIVVAPAPAGAATRTATDEDQSS